ncbi:hypothetical protein E2320_004741 [Naja naja]|nr:hypothetical protein E2320_004741 [Naja naja]
MGKTKRKTSARDASPTPSTDAEYPSNGSSADRIYDLNIPAYVKFAYMAERDDELSLVKGSRPSDFSVSLKASGKNKHFKVQLVDNVYCIGQRRFNTMDELVEHYKKAPIFTSEHGEKLYLVKALQ